MSGPTTIRGDSLAQAPELARSLNAIILDLRRDIAGLRARLPQILPPLEFTTPVTPANMFPIRIRGPGFTPKSVIVARLENLTSPQLVTTVGPAIHWDNSDGGFIKILNIFGLAASSNYRITLEAFGG